MAKTNVTLRQAFTQIIWPRRWLLFLGLILILINRLTAFVIPYSTKEIIDVIVPTADLNRLKAILFMVVGALLIQAVTSFSLTQLLSVEAQRLIAKLRVQVQQKIMMLPVGFFDEHKSGELVSRIITDVEGVRNLVGTGLVQLFGGVITSIIALAYSIYISPNMTLLVIGPMILFGLISLKAFQTIRPIFRKRGEINAEVTGRLTESLNGIRVIKGFNAEQQEIKTFESGVDKLFRNIRKTLTSTSLITSSGTFLIGLASAGVMGLGGYYIISGQLTYGEFVAFPILLGFMIAPIVQMSSIGTQITEAFAGLDRMEEIMRRSTENDDPDRQLFLPVLNGDLKFDEVSFGYEENSRVVHDISFEARPGTVTALVGSSGSGKSTIAGLTATFLQPDSGTITVDGVNLSEVILHSYRKQLGVVLQDDFLFEGTIRENILFPRPDATENQLLDAVRSAHVEEFTDRFEEGLETTIGERGVKLSGGQRQRVAIARAIPADPRILILDEATSNLDTESEAFIQESLSRLMVGRTTLVIAHRLSTIRKADQILVVEHGRIVERGSHDELMEKEGRYHRLYTYQARI